MSSDFMGSTKKQAQASSSFDADCGTGFFLMADG
jgi:hypothetical protein